MGDCFAAGDNVFAKVRGFPQWPARIEAVSSTTSNTHRYHVLFYGTLERGICTRGNLFEFTEERRKNLLSSRRKMLHVALAQCDGQIPLPEQVRRVGEIDSVGTNGSRGKSVTCEKINVKKGGGKNLLRRGKHKSSSRPVTRSSDAPLPEFVSRSGRRIKPKRFADDVVFYQIKSFTRGPTNRPRLVKEANVMDGGLKCYEYLIKDHTIDEGKLTVRFVKVKNPGNTPQKKHVKIVDEDGSQVGKNSKEVTPTLLHRKNPIPTNNLLRYCVKKRMKDNGKNPDTMLYSSQSRRLSNPKEREGHQKFERILEKRREKREAKTAWLNLEMRILALEHNVRTSLNKENADPQKALVYLNTLINTHFEPLMLKKHPRIVETIDKVAVFHGDASGYSKNRKYKAYCRELRKKAEVLMGKFAKMFDTPVGTTFREYFDDCVAKFMINTWNLSTAQFYALMVEPPQLEDEKEVNKDC